MGLSVEEREELTGLVSKGTGAARKLTHARVVRLADEGESGAGWTDQPIGDGLGTSHATVERTRQACVEEGLEVALNPKRPYRTRSGVLDGKAEAHLVKMACSTPPDGRECWTMQWLADQWVEVAVIESVSDETVRTTLKKKTLNRG